MGKNKKKPAEKAAAQPEKAAAQPEKAAAQEETKKEAPVEKQKKTATATVAKKDHISIGKEQGIFDMHEMSPGCGFMYPFGTKIYNKLIDLVRDQYRYRGFKEVLSPNVFNVRLWKTSGDFNHSKADFFLFKTDDATNALKPMNGPAHCVMYGSEMRSFRDLPIRLADFGVLHKAVNDLEGLKKTRRSQQDDAHIFCKPDQIRDEVKQGMLFLYNIYDIFGLEIETKITLCPDAKLRRAGTEEQWD